MWDYYGKGELIREMDERLQMDFNEKQVVFDDCGAVVCSS